MNFVHFKKRRFFPEQIRIVNKTYIMRPASRLKPFVEAKESDEGQPTGDKDRLTTLLQKIKKKIKLRFGRRDVSSNLDYNTFNGR